MLLMGSCSGLALSLVCLFTGPGSPIEASPAPTNFTVTVPTRCVGSVACCGVCAKARVPPTATQRIRATRRATRRNGLLSIVFKAGDVS